MNRQNYFFFAIVMSLLLIESAAADCETGLGPEPFFTHPGSGADFIVTGDFTRRYDVTIQQSEPFDLEVPQVPQDATLIAAFIMWTYDECALPPSSSAIEIDSNESVGGLVGYGTPDLCHVGGCLCFNTILTSAYVLEVDVTPGSTITIGGITGTNSSGCGPLAEGVTLLLVYDFSESSGELTVKSVDLYAGYISNTPGGVPYQANATLSFSTTYNSGSVHFLINAINGEQDTQQGDWTDNFFINNTIVGGTLGGTGSTTDAWQGLLGANQHTNFYDHAQGDIGSLIPGNSDSFTIRTEKGGQNGAGDCVGHSFVVVSYNYVPQYPDFTAG